MKYVRARTYVGILFFPRVSDGISKFNEARLSYVIEAHFCVPKETGSVFLLSNYIGARGVAIIVLLVFSVVVVVGEQFLIKKVRPPSVYHLKFTAGPYQQGAIATMADDHPAAAAAAAAVGPNALVIAASDDAAASASCIKCRYCKVVLRQDDEVVSCDLCASVCCGKCWGQRGSRCSNSGGKGGNPCHADGAYDSWEFKIGENLEMDLAHGFVRAARGEEDRAFGWLQLQFQAIRHGIAMQLAATTDDELSGKPGGALAHLCHPGRYRWSGGIEGVQWKVHPNQGISLHRCR